MTLWLISLLRSDMLRHSSSNLMEFTEDPFHTAGIIESQNSMAKRDTNVVFDSKYEDISDDDFEVPPSQNRYVDFIY